MTQPLVFLFCYLAIHGVEALPMPAAALTSQLKSTAPPSTDTRTIHDIVWSCLATVFACTWVAIHPNIPEHNRGYIMNIFYRIRIMLLALLAPEIVISWAGRQWYVAGELAQKYKCKVVFTSYGMY